MNTQINNGKLKQISVSTVAFLLLLGMVNTVRAEMTLYYVHNDHLGTPQAMTDRDQTIVWKAEQTPFGETIVDEDPDGDGKSVTLNVRFPGQYYDEETGLHYNYFRYYDPSIGRYITSDRVGLTGGTNTYGYALQSPINYLDPNGLLSFNPFDLFGLGIGRAQGALCAERIINKFGCAILGNPSGGPAIILDVCTDLFENLQPPSGTSQQLLECTIECERSIEKTCNARVCTDPSLSDTGST